MRRSSNYVPSQGLKAVVELAIAIKMPLLVTGEPGTGKTKLAEYVAFDILGLEKPPYKFNTKTDSVARDLFYSYDAIGHFRESERREGSENVMDYITFEALGKAIIESGEGQSVVLIDEVDKAPRDFPNDVLHELENLSFRVKEARVEDIRLKLGGKAQIDEQGFVGVARQENQPVIILTSNSEKNLPDAFLRRILYHHIEFPDKDTLEKIVRKQIETPEDLDHKLLNAAIKHFMDIRDNLRLRKAPATAELISWIHVLHRQNIPLEEILSGSEKELKDALINTYSLIAKNKEDMQKLVMNPDLQGKS